MEVLKGVHEKHCLGDAGLPWPCLSSEKPILCVAELLLASGTADGVTPSLVLLSRARYAAGSY